jgi:hypothetical protein
MSELAPVKNVALVQERMHPLFEKASGLTESIIAAAIEVHRGKGPGWKNRCGSICWWRIVC